MTNLTKEQLEWLAAEHEQKAKEYRELAKAMDIWEPKEGGYKVLCVLKDADVKLCNDINSGRFKWPVE